MGKTVQLPTRGQPVDLSYLYELADAINQNAKEVSTTKGLVSISATPTDVAPVGQTTRGTSIFGASFKVIPTTGDTVDISTTIPVTISFSGVSFKTKPVVSATPITIGTGKDANSSATVTISELTTSGCKALVKFSNSGSIQNLYLHVIAIGTPV